MQFPQWTASPVVGFPSCQLPQWSVLVSFPSGRFPHPSGQFPGGQCRSEQCRSVSVGRCRSVSVSFGQFPQWSVSPVVSFPGGQCRSVSRVVGLQAVGAAPAQLPVRVQGVVAVLRRAGMVRGLDHGLAV